MKPLTSRFLCGVVCLTALAAACGSEVTDKPAAPVTKATKKVDAATAGSITGSVKFDGVVPAAELIRMSTDRKCVQDGGPNPQSDALLIAEDKSVANTFVYVKEGLDPDYAFDTPATPAVLDQKGCIYSPRILGVRVGQAIEVVNSDPTMHNVHALPMANQEFNRSQTKQFSKLSEVFTTPEVMVRFKCDVHGWMAAYVGVVAHPYFAVSDKTGAFKIDGLPPGSYTLEAWHEKLGTKTSQVTIAPNQAQPVAVTYTELKK